MSTGLKTLKIFLSYQAKRPWLMIGSYLMGPATVLMYTISPLFIAKVVGQLSAKQAVSNSYLLLAALSLIGGALLWYVIDNYLNKPLVARVGEDLHKANFEHLLKQDYNFFTDNFGGSLVAQANRFVKAYELFHTVFFLDVLGQFCSVLVAIGVMIYYNWAIGLSVTVLWLLAISLVIYLGIRRMPIRRHAVAMETRQTGELADAVTNVMTIKTFASESNEIQRYNQTNHERTRRYLKSWDVAIKNQFAVNVLSFMLQMVVLIGGIYSVQRGQISVAIFLLFEVYILRIIDSVNKSGLFVRQFEGLLGDAHEMTELLDRVPQVNDPNQPEKRRMHKGLIEFKDVSFHYPDQNSQTSLFEHFDLEIKPGQHIGLVGPSGGGKTTITRLLLRFHDIDSGEITIDGQNIARITQQNLHDFVAYVPQEPLLFHRSLSDNIGYGSHADIAQIKDAAQKAHAHNFIKSLPKGYDTLVGERGIKLSGGQRQRVAIARAMLKNAPILVLDEATSALDSESEKLVQDALWQLMKDKTALVIAHRLSTIQRMDRIVVLDQGKLIEEGTHKELLKKNGLYATLWKHQSGGFIEE